jgi:hypothetical protein
MEFKPIPVEPLSYREYVDQYGGGLEEFSLQSLAYLLQQRRDGLDEPTIVKWESRLMDTRYNANAYQQLTLEENV